jgi:segregation and condensation protein B
LRAFSPARCLASLDAIRNVPTPGAPYAYVTTPTFLSHFGFESLRDLPDIEKLEDAGLIRETSDALRDGAALNSELRGALALSEDEAEEDAA